MATPARTGEDRILTVPNLLTTVRLACVPVFVWLLLRPHRTGWYPAALLLGGLGVTDGADGYVARRFDQVSTVGKVLDPLADRLLLGAAAVGTVAVGALPVWVATVALAREALVAGGFLYVASAGGGRMDVQWAGKAATFALMVALPLFLTGHADDSWHGVAAVLAWVFALPGLALGWFAAATYVAPARRALEEGRRLRAVSSEGRLGGRRERGAEGPQG